MNIVKILLVLGLGYVALTQKVEKTRNMLLVVTGLLAFCMFSVEGFDSITFNGGTTTSNASAGGTITGSTNGDYVFPQGFNLETGLPIPTYTCGDGKVPVTAPVDSVLSEPLSDSNVESAYPCNDAPSGTPCPSPAPDPHQCGDDKIYKSDITGLTFTGDQGGANYKSSCCEDGCSDDDCSIFNSGENTKCGEVDILGLGILKIDKKCK